jgi:hypothetical protein
MATETFVAVVLAISIGVLAEWTFYLELPATVRASVALVPFALSILTFSMFPLFRWVREGAPIGGIVLFGFARWYYRRRQFPLVQIVWPNSDGCNPWSPGATKAFKE